MKTKRIAMQSHALILSANEIKTLADQRHVWIDQGDGRRFLLVPEPTSSTPVVACRCGKVFESKGESTAENRRRRHISAMRRLGQKKNHGDAQ